MFIAHVFLSLKSDLSASERLLNSVFVALFGFFTTSAIRDRTHGAQFRSVNMRIQVYGLYGLTGDCLGSSRTVIAFFRRFLEKLLGRDPGYKT